jgi:ABC-2 type transport system permease protein
LFTDVAPVTGWVMAGRRRSLILWGIAMAAVAALYTAMYPAMGGAEMARMTEELPEGMVKAFGYEEIGTAAGYIGSTVYGLLGPVLLLVFGVGLGARLVAGDEESGRLELELTGPVSRRSVYLERLAALWISVAVLTLVVAAATGLLALLLGMDLPAGHLAAATVGLLLLTLLHATVAYAVGTTTGRRAAALGAASALAVAAFMLDALGPATGADWMTAISPLSWYRDPNPLVHGSDPSGLLLLGLVTAIVAVAGLARFRSRDLMV